MQARAPPTTERKLIVPQRGKSTIDLTHARTHERNETISRLGQPQGLRPPNLRIHYAYSISNTSHYLHAPKGPAVWCVALGILRLGSIWWLQSVFLDVQEAFGRILGEFEKHFKRTLKEFRWDLEGF